MRNMNTKNALHIVFFVSWFLSVVLVVFLCTSSVNGYNSAIKNTYPIVVYEHDDVIESLVGEQAVGKENDDTSNDAIDRMERYREKLTTQRDITVYWMIGISIYAGVGSVLYFCVRDSHKKRNLFTILLVFNLLLFMCFVIFAPQPISRV